MRGALLLLSMPFLSSCYIMPPMPRTYYAPSATNVVLGQTGCGIGVKDIAYLQKNGAQVRAITRLGSNVELKLTLYAETGVPWVDPERLVFLDSAGQPLRPMSAASGLVPDYLPRGDFYVKRMLTRYANVRFPVSSAELKEFTLTFPPGSVQFQELDVDFGPILFKLSTDLYTDMSC